MTAEMIAGLFSNIIQGAGYHFKVQHGLKAGYPNICLLQMESAHPKASCRKYLITAPPQKQTTREDSEVRIFCPFHQK